jgi:hypothetical protein
MPSHFVAIEMTMRFATRIDRQLETCVGGRQGHVGERHMREGDMVGSLEGVGCTREEKGSRTRKGRRWP